MSGNVMEWCFDKNDSGRVERGGSWAHRFSWMMIGNVQFYDPAYYFVHISNGYVGFRPVRTN